MKRLGYTQFVAQGGDWGNAVTEQMALLAPPELLGIHTNMPATVPDDVEKALHGGPAVSGLSDDEKRAYDQLDFFYKHGLGYAQEMAGRPQTLYALADSPAGLAAWMLDHDARSLALITCAPTTCIQQRSIGENHDSTQGERHRGLRQGDLHGENPHHRRPRKWRFSHLRRPARCQDFAARLVAYRHQSGTAFCGRLV